MRNDARSTVSTETDQPTVGYRLTFGVTHRRRPPRQSDDQSSLRTFRSRLYCDTRRRHFRSHMANYIGSKFGQADHAKLVTHAILS